MFEAGDTFSKPSFLVSMLDFANVSQKKAPIFSASQAAKLSALGSELLKNWLYWDVLRRYLGSMDYFTPIIKGILAAPKKLSVIFGGIRRIPGQTPKKTCSFSPDEVRELKNPPKIYPT